MGRKTAIFCLLAIACYVSCNQETNQSELSKKDHAGSNSVQSDERNRPRDRIKRQADAESATNLCRGTSSYVDDGSEHSDDLSVTSDFCELVLYNDDKFVDKSLFIRQFLTAETTVPVIRRPHGWGKTINANMLKRFLEMELDENGNPIPEERSVNRKLFAGGHLRLTTIGKTEQWKQLKRLRIADDAEIMSKYQGQHPVIYVSFGSATADTYHELIENLREIVIRLYLSFHYVVPKINNEFDRGRFGRYCTGRFNESEIDSSVYFLSSILHSVYKKHVYILVDDHDVPINHFYVKLNRQLGNWNESIPAAEQFEKLVNLISSTIIKSIRSSTHIKRALLVGVAMNTLLNYNALDEKLSGHFGFTDTELGDLLKNVTDVSEENLERVRRWYCGFKFGIGPPLCYPYSIKQFISNSGKFDYYYLNDGDGSARILSQIDHLVRSDWFRPTLQTLVAGQSVRSTIYDIVNFDTGCNRQDRLINILLLLNRLCPVGKDHQFFSVAACNEELRHFYERKLERILDRDLWNPAKLRLARLLFLLKFDEFNTELTRFTLEYLNETKSLNLVNSHLYTTVVKGLLQSENFTAIGATMIDRRYFDRPLFIMESLDELYSNTTALIACTVSKDEEGAKHAVQDGLQYTSNMTVVYNKNRKSDAAKPKSSRIKQIINLSVTLVTSTLKTIIRHNVIDLKN